MAKIALIFFFILIAGTGYGQQDHFALIRADNDQPFYVRFREQTLSSSAQGHLILSQLHDSVYPISVGFPRQQFATQEFIIGIDHEDPEFLLKYIEGEGWGLLNVETQELQRPKKETEAKMHLEGIKKDDAFSRLMAGVVSDTAVMYNTYTMETLPDSGMISKTGAGSRKTVVPAVVPPVVPPVATPPVVSSSIVTPSVVTPSSISPSFADSTARRSDAGALQNDSFARQKEFHPAKTDSSARNTDSFALRTIPASPKMDHPARKTDSVVRRTDSFVRRTDAVAGKTDSLARKVNAPDTLARVSPNNPAPVSALSPKKPRAAPAPHIEKISEQKTATALRLSYSDHARRHISGYRTDTIDILIPFDTVIAQKNGSNGGSKDGIKDSPKDKLRDTARTGQPPTAAGATAKQARPKPVVVNSDCHNYASDDDADKLKAKMQGILSDDGKIASAKKVFKVKCFNTIQLRSLCEIFGSEENKYRFLESAYPFVSDDHFRELSDLFTDPAVMNQFKTLVGPDNR